MNFLRVLTVFFVLVTARSATAEENDYGFDNKDWNGLSAFAADAQAHGIRAGYRTTVDFNNMDTNTALMILYPKSRIPASDLVSFVAAGGIVILADDFGDSESFLEHVGVKRVKASDVVLVELYRKSSAHPIAKPDDKTHPLSAGIERLVLNHPAFFVSEHRTVFSAGEEKVGVVISIPLGRGELILISDPSLFINLMQRFKCNRGFARNLLKRLAKNRTSDLWVTSHNFDIKGTYQSTHEPESVPRMVENPVVLLFSKIRNLLNTWTDYRLSPDVIIPLSIILCGVILIFLVRRMPVRTVSYDGRWTFGGERQPPGRFYARMKKYSSGSTSDFLEPACLLRDQVDRELENRLKTPSPITLLRVKKVVQILEKEYSTEAAAAYRTLYADVFRLPSTERLREHVPRKRFPLRKLRKIEVSARRLIDILDRRTIS